ncbi:glycoside hydrolase family 30 protein [Flavobacterium branchiophilum]|uniref:Glycoside hydrolase, family 30 n=1 Tax=Flavobacterium branchiophilum (strain FL-15) TaxID=1034807 RepID=G2Z797_FLABF|nr:glycoside hydrolase family 30 protein [Flavobacterium branchiophilum]CCB69401.1 Glycoside hydrolase precursor, family 30 [Flavobacterium branchiophilum FL-15]
MKKITIFVHLLTTFFVFSQNKKNTNPSTFSVNNRTVEVYTSADNSLLRLSKDDKIYHFETMKQPLETQICIFVNPEKKFQKFLGIGGAITDASAEVFARLNPDKQQELLEAYFSKTKGIGYTVVRTNMHSCDFSSHSYTYVQEGDKDLKTFSLAPDQKFRLPLLKRALQTIGNSYTFYVSPWSPPAFMKDNQSMLEGGKLLPEYYQTWANYYVKYINALQNEGLNVWGLTIQNEPMAKQRWESCIYSAEEERDFLKNYLGPTLKKAGLGQKKIIVWDHNRDLISQRAHVILSDSKASQYAWGVGFHWYENWSGGNPMFENIKHVNDLYPNKNLMFTEGCVERFDPSKYQLWANGERYGRSMIHDFNNGTVGWTDWNILLDENGGPNHVQNFCFAPIHADSQSGNLIYTPSYYFLGHFSKFIDKNAHRVSSVASRSQLLTTSFLNPNGKLTTIIMNETNQNVQYYLCIGASAVALDILPHSIQTVVF